ncbi:MAG: HupE/UreJ family protein [Pseudomonadota bacterium]
MRVLLYTLLGLGLAGFPALASAHVSGLERHDHQAGVFYTALSIGSERSALLLTVPRLAAAELGAGSPSELIPFALDAFAISNFDQACELGLIEANDYTAIDAFQVEMTVTCAQVPGELYLQYHLMEGKFDHINHLEISLGDQFTFTELGQGRREVEIPVEFLIWDQGWTLPAEPAPLRGKAPKLSDYFVLGFQHVLTGYDHMAFLLGLLVVVTQLRSLVWLITAFTVAHSITLAVSALDILTINIRFTEIAIAMTIFYIGAENLWFLIRRHKTPGLHRRWLTTFTFGLIHGFGFSFILREIGLPTDEFVPALLLFNLGVEAAQLIAVVLPFVIIQYWLRHRRWWTALSTTASAGILGLGTWWLIERTLLS